MTDMGNPLPVPSHELTGCCPNKNHSEQSLTRCLLVNLGEAKDERFEPPRYYPPLADQLGQASRPQVSEYDLSLVRNLIMALV
jgi:hypothetical protein